MRAFIALGLATAFLLFVLPPKGRTGADPRQGLDGGQAFGEAPREGPRPGVSRVAPQPESRLALLLAGFEAETDPDLRGEVAERTVASASSAELPGFVDALGRDVRPGAGELGLRFLRRWAEDDPSAAAAWTSRFSEGSEGSGWRAAVEQVAMAWANADLPAATGWVWGLPAGEARNAATFALAYEAARTEPVAALELASRLPATRERDDLLAHAVSQWAGVDPALASTWAMAEEDPALRQRLVASVAIAVAASDSPAAVVLAVTGLDGGEEQDRAVVSIVQRWVQQAPPGAASWVARFPDLPLREAVVENLLVHWDVRDSAAAAAWVDGLPPGRLRDAAFTVHARVRAVGSGAAAPAPTEPAGGG